MSKQYSSNLECAIDLVTSSFQPEQIDSFLILNTEERNAFFKKLDEMYPERIAQLDNCVNWNVSKNDIFENMSELEQIKAISIRNVVFKRMVAGASQRHIEEYKQSLLLQLHESSEQLIQFVNSLPTKIDRENMTIDEERLFVKLMFDKYENNNKGFVDQFWTPYTDYADRIGQHFEVLCRVTEKESDLCNLPQWFIKFDDGVQILAHPEEIVIVEMENNKSEKKND